jgi:hypothetical protein
LQENPSIGLLGTWCRFSDKETGITYNYTTPVHHDHILKAMPLRNVFIHPTIMFRSAEVKKGLGYPETYPYAEDYAFCWRLLQLTKGAILPHYLVTCAISRGGLSLKNRKQQLRSRKKVIQAFGKKGWKSKMGVIKIYLLILLPKEVLLRLKGFRNKSAI